MGHVIHENKSHRRYVGSLKLYVSFAEYSLFYRALLQKRPIILSWTYGSCHTWEWVTSHTWMSHVRYMNASCHLNEYVMSHLRMRNVACMNESCRRIYEWVMSNIWMSLGTQTQESCRADMKESYHTREWVMHRCLSHVTCVNESCIDAWVTSRMSMSYVTCHTCTWVTSHACHIWKWVTNVSALWLRCTYIKSQM